MTAKTRRTVTVDTTKPPSKLAEIADEMRAQLGTGPGGSPDPEGAPNGRPAAVHRALMRGLQVVLARNGKQWRLALGREGVYPSDVEVEVCRRAFQAPVGAEITRREATSRHPKTGRKIRHLVVELMWLELHTQVG